MRSKLQLCTRKKCQLNVKVLPVCGLDTFGFEIVGKYLRTLVVTNSATDV